jgi:Spy/CpxP family protein refolding chaperone
MGIKMKRFVFSTAMVIVLTSDAALGQSHQPYAGLQSRPIKSLSDGQIDDLRSGRGMGLALAAELNGYPGPIHVLELADQLQLSTAQREKTQALSQAMKNDAVPLGEKLIADETELDRRFANKTITQASLEASLQTIGVTQGALRAAHLKYHLSMLEVLTPMQIHRYTQLRGYSSDSNPQMPHEHGGHGR